MTALLFVFSIGRPAFSQSSAVARLFVDGKLSDWPSRVDVSTVGLDAALESATDYWRTKGYFLVRIDSVSGGNVYLNTGDAAIVESIGIMGTSLIEPSDLRELIDIDDDGVLDIGVLESGMTAILNRYAGLGHYLTSAEIATLEPVSSGSSRYKVVLRIYEGPLVRITGLELPGAIRTRTSFAVRISGIRSSGVIRKKELESFATRLRDSAVFKAVGEPRLKIFNDSTALVSIPVEETPPGTFDIVLGYLPPNGIGGSGQVVGSGHLSLSNPFGYGRTFGLQLDQRPGQVSSVEVRLADPQVAGYPLRLEGRFNGFQQDSTYGRQSISVEAGYRLGGGVELFGRYAAEDTRPGQAGIRFQGSQQRIARADAGFWGVGVTINTLDDRINPRSGISMKTLIERGDKKLERSMVSVDGDTTRVATAQRQERLLMSSRLHVPTFRRQSLVVGVDINVLLSEAYDESDLFRFGGATTLRGYDEDRFLASTAMRAVFEYRSLLDATSYVYLFFDLGYVERPKLPLSEPTESWHPGFGLGMQFETAVGIIQTSYAVNNEDGLADGRIHVGLSFGL